jgi:hypothetical protein
VTRAELRPWSRLGAGITIVVAGALGGCGARTPLDVSAAPSGERDAAGADGGSDAGDVEDDAGPADAEPQSDVTVAPIAAFDASVPADSALACPDGGLPTAYLLDQNGALYTFSPATLEATRLGLPDCGEALLDESPWTFSVSRDGVAYLLLENWLIYAVDLATLSCRLTPFRADQLGIDQDFAIAISRTSAEEQMFYVGGTLPPFGGPLLAASDLGTFTLHELGPALPVPSIAGNMTGSLYDAQADLTGHVFVFVYGGLLEELDATSGRVLGADETGFVASGNDASFAVMTYEDDVYLFADGAVARYDFTLHAPVPLGSVHGLTDVFAASAVPCYGVR